MPNEMERCSTFAATTAGKRFCPRPSVLGRGTSLEAAVDKNAGNEGVISEAASDESVPAPVLSAALYERFSRPGQDDFADKFLSALHYQFGGHEEKAASKKDGAL
jgi:hypothetical protein